MLTSVKARRRTHTLATALLLPRHESTRKITIPFYIRKFLSAFPPSPPRARSCSPSRTTSSTAHKATRTYYLPPQ